MIYQSEAEEEEKELVINPLVDDSKEESSSSSSEALSFESDVRNLKIESSKKSDPDKSNPLPNRN